MCWLDLFAHASELLDVIGSADLLPSYPDGDPEARLPPGY